MIYVDDIKRIFSDANRTYEPDSDTVNTHRSKRYKHNNGVADDSHSEFRGSHKIYKQGMAEIKVSKNVEVNWILRLTKGVVSLSIVGIKLVWTYLTYRSNRRNSAEQL
mgnify:FL=1|jgi:hypothetical protein